MNHLPFEVSLTELRTKNMDLRDVALSRLGFNLVKHISPEKGIDH